MKVRTGFVSNSSSSSFVAWGVESSLIQVNDTIWLNVFNERLDFYERMAQEGWKYPYALRLEELKQYKTDAEKITYARDCLSFDYDIDGFTQGGQDHDFVGLTVGALCSRHPDTRLGDIDKLVADELNRIFGTSFDANDIQYREEAWYDG